MQRGLLILSNEYAVTDNRNENACLMTLAVQVCVGVGLMLQDKFNTAAVAHFFAHAQTLDNAPRAFREYVDDGVDRMLEDIGYRKGMPVRAALSGGWEGWGGARQSELLVEFTHAALRRVEGLEIVYDSTLRKKNEDIYTDSATGRIGPAPDAMLGTLVTDNEDRPEFSMSSKAHLARLNGIEEGWHRPGGSRLFRHPLSAKLNQ